MAMPTGLQQRTGPVELQSTDRSSQSVGGLLQRLTHELSTLFRQELALAAAEVSQTLGRLLGAVTTTAAGGAMLFSGLLVLLAAAVLGLSQVMAAWLAAVLVGAAVSIIGVVMVLAGVRALPETLRPARTTHSLSKDKDVLTRKTP